MSLLPRSIDRLRQEAKALSKKEGITHTSALELVSRSYGFPNWKAVLKASEKSHVVKQPTSPVPEDSVDGGDVSLRREGLERG